MLLHVTTHRNLELEAQSIQHHDDDLLQLFVKITRGCAGNSTRIAALDANDDGAILDALQVLSHGSRGAPDGNQVFTSRWAHGVRDARQVLQEVHKAQRRQPVLVSKLVRHLQAAQGECDGGVFEIKHDAVGLGALHTRKQATVLQQRLYFVKRDARVLVRVYVVHHLQELFVLSEDTVHLQRVQSQLTEVVGDDGGGAREVRLDNVHDKILQGNVRGPLFALELLESDAAQCVHELESVQAGVVVVLVVVLVPVVALRVGQIENVGEVRDLARGAVGDLAVVAHVQKLPQTHVVVAVPGAVEVERMQDGVVHSPERVLEIVQALGPSDHVPAEQSFPGQARPVRVKHAVDHPLGVVEGARLTLACSEDGPLYAPGLPGTVLVLDFPLHALLQKKTMPLGLEHAVEGALGGVSTGAALVVHHCKEVLGRARGHVRHGPVVEHLHRGGALESYHRGGKAG
mmetsp:Transcript_2776/g.5503  ORF Transcript_2776/g.5503 Transcript_2776/m.5503 type:complete len:459 (+) Transcript_2776:396-1772(+)